MVGRLFILLTWFLIISFGASLPKAQAQIAEIGPNVCVLTDYGHLNAQAVEAKASAFDCASDALNSFADHFWLRIDLSAYQDTFEDPALRARLSHHGAMTIAPIFQNGEVRPTYYSKLDLIEQTVVPGYLVFPLAEAGENAPEAVLIGIEDSWDPLNWSDIELMSYAAAQTAHLSNTLIYSLLMGVLVTPLVLVMLVYPVLRYGFLPYHFGMLACALIYAFSWSGLIFVLPFDITPEARSVINHLAIAMAFFFATNLTRTLCSVEDIGQTCHEILPISGMLFVIVSVAFMIIAPELVHTGSVIIHTTAVLPVLAILVSLLNGARNNSQIARLQLLAWTPMLAYVVGRIARGLGFIDETSALEFGLFPSLLLESFLTSALVIYRIYEIRVERDKAISERAQLRSLASSDVLTGALNRRAFVEHFDQTVVSGITASRALTLIVIDIDHFKSVNDKFGHTFGDEVLVRVSEFLREHCRGEDAYARFGGEEFCMLISTATKSDANACAERLRKAVAAHEFAEDLTVTISIGMVSVTDDISVTFTSWFEAADKALYTAKNEGRNRTQWSGWRPSSTSLDLPADEEMWTLKRA